MNSKAATFGLKNPYWDLSKSKYTEVDELPLMGSIGPVITILALYLIFVLKIGPAFMKKREPYKLTNILIAYNGVQVIISAYLMIRFFNNLLEMGIIPKKCILNEEKGRQQTIISIYIYLAAKFSELLDTIFFVLRKKYNQISFLHLYHHTCMVLATWALLKYWPSHTLIFTGCLNSLVHVFMYTYYGLAAFGPHVAKYLFWKKYITTFQLLQFISVSIQYITAVMISECPPSRTVAICYSCNTVFFFILFLNFYRNSYKKKNHSVTDFSFGCMVSPKKE